MQRHLPVIIIAGLFATPVAAQDIPTLDAIIVTATRIPTQASEVIRDVSIIDRNAIDLSADATVSELIARLPGVQVTTAGGRGDASTLSIRGGNTAHALVLVDGLRISSATLGTSAIHALPAGLFSRVELARGPMSSLYGTDAMSGAVQLFTRDPRTASVPEVHVGIGQYGTRLGSVALGAQVGEGAFSLLAGAEHSDGFSSVKASKAGLFDLYNPDRDAYDNRYVNAAFAHRVSAQSELEVRYLHSESMKRYDATNCDSFYITCTTNFDNRNQQFVESLQASLAGRVADAWLSRLRVGRSRDNQRNWLFDPSTGNVSVDYYETGQNQALWQNDIALAGGKAMLALEWRGLEVGSSKPFVVDSQTTRSAMAGYQARFGAHAVEASVRQDRISRLGRHGSHSLGYGYRVSPAWTAHASLGRAFHAPNFNDLYWPLDPVNFYQGNPNLRPETARNREIGLAYAAAGDAARLTLYHNRVSDLIDYVPGVAPTFIGTMGNLNAATLKGATLEFSRVRGAWSWRALADWLSAKDDATGLTLQRRAPRTGTLELGYKSGGLDLRGRLRAVDARFNNTANTQRLAGFGLLDLEARYRIDRAWSLEGRLDNLLDRDYVEVRSTLNPFNDYSVSGRALFLGLRYAPK